MRKLICFVAITLAFAACHSSDNDRQALKKRYNDFWKTSTHPDFTQAKTLDEGFKSYYLKYPDDTGLPSMLFDDAQLNINALQNPNEGIRLLDRLINDYPHHRRVPDALYLEAFTYEDTYHNNDKAKEKYNEIITRFPNHPYAEQAKQNINLLGKDLNQWIKHLSDSVKQAKGI